MITSMPRDSAALANSNSRSGVRWAETILVSCGTPNSFRVSEAICIVPQSDLLPIIIETIGLFAILVLCDLRPHHRFEFVPRLYGASPIDDLSRPVYHDIFGENAE